MWGGGIAEVPCRVVRSLRSSSLVYITNSSLGYMMRPSDRGESAVRETEAAKGFQSQQLKCVRHSRKVMPTGEPVLQRQAGPMLCDAL